MHEWWSGQKCPWSMKWRREDLENEDLEVKTWKPRRNPTAKSTCSLSALITQPILWNFFVLHAGHKPVNWECGLAQTKAWTAERWKVLHNRSCVAEINEMKPVGVNQEASWARKPTKTWRANQEQNHQILTESRMKGSSELGFVQTSEHAIPALLTFTVVLGPGQVFVQSLAFQGLNGLLWEPVNRVLTFGYQDPDLFMPLTAIDFEQYHTDGYRPSRRETVCLLTRKSGLASVKTWDKPRITKITKRG